MLVEILALQYFRNINHYNKAHEYKPHYMRIVFFWGGRVQQDKIHYYVIVTSSWQPESFSGTSIASAEQHQALFPPEKNKFPYNMCSQ